MRPKNTIDENFNEFNLGKKEGQVDEKMKKSSDGPIKHFLLSESNQQDVPPSFRWLARRVK